MTVAEGIDQLFRPLHVRSMTIPNRFAMAPMTRQASPGGVPGQDVADPEAGFPESIPTLSAATHVAWRRVTDAVHANGAVIAAQLWHQGSERDEADGVLAVSPSGVDGRGEPKGRALSAADLARVADQYGQAALEARRAGFDAIEIHGAHGYLLDQFFWERTNLRTDDYGGPLANRTRFPAQVVAAVRSAVGPDFPIVFRFSQWKSADYDAAIAADPTELQEVLAPLLDAGVDVLHPSARRHYAPAFPDAEWGCGPRTAGARRGRSSLRRPSTTSSTASRRATSTSSRSAGRFWPTRRG